MERYGRTDGVIEGFKKRKMMMEVTVELVVKENTCNCGEANLRTTHMLDFIQGKTCRLAPRTYHDGVNRCLHCDPFAG